MKGGVALNIDSYMSLEESKSVPLYEGQEREESVQKE